MEIGARFEMDPVPFPNDDMRHEALSSVLALLLHQLMSGAGCLAMAPLGLKPDTNLLQELDALLSAARRLRLGSVALNQRIWTRTAPFWTGEMANRLEALPAGERYGFLLVFALAANRHGLFFGHARPIPVETPVAGDLDADGPYLALVRCRHSWTGKLIASHAHVQAIASGRCFMPVASSFERDIVRLLAGLQESLDRHGIDCAIIRSFEPEGKGLASRLLIETSREGRTLKSLHLFLEPDGTSPIATGPCQDALRILPDSLTDGSMVRWLERAIIP